MAQVLRPWQILVATFAGWINEQQQAVIDYLREENRVLKEQLGDKRLLLTDDQRRRLAAKAKPLAAVPWRMWPRSSRRIRCWRGIGS